MQQSHHYPIRKIGLIATFAGLALWIVLLLLWSPTFAGIDAPFFKEAGINLAQGEGLVARADPHVMSWEPLSYRTYPPFFPLLYGLFVAIIGVSAKSNLLFDALLNMLAALLFLYAVLPHRGGRGELWPSLLLLVLVLATLPAGPFWQQRDRPDVLGLMLIILTVLLLQDHFTHRRLVTAGLCLGLNLLLSPFAFFLHGLVIFMLAGRAFLSGNAPQTSGQLFRLVLAGLAGFAFPLLLYFLPGIGIFDPDAGRQLLAHATGQSRAAGSGLGYFLMLAQGDIAGYFSAFQHYRSFSNLVRLLYLVWVVLLLLGFFLLFHRQYRGRVAHLTWASLLLIAFLPPLLIPYQLNYMALTAALLLVLFARLLLPDTGRPQLLGRWLIAIAFAFIAFFQFLNLSRDLYVAYRAGPSYQAMQDTLDELAPAPGESPLRVLTPHEQIFLFYGRDGFIPLPYYETTAEQIQQADLVVFHFTGDTDPLAEFRPELLYRKTLESVYLPEQPPPRLTLFGRDITRGTDSWTMAIYRP